MTEVITTNTPAPSPRSISLRIRYAAVVGAELISPIIAGVAALLAANAYLHDSGPEAGRLALLGGLAVAAGILAQTFFGDALRRTTARINGQLRGGRTWSCASCGASIRADRWSDHDINTAERLLGDPDAHGCTGLRT
ncbi:MULTISPECIES: hypothetical protein [unclassified Streptomyces]|uniref:hypothetical protein n=1 Tax=unclassified Streptomyces TaxID=2593676 RepID=UPI000DC78105|nr:MULTISPECIES: hypothetical protein [unclassified Streptomyces]AWZ06876.1 hypothetical protein DRB89_22175 [Streptomyces sp. ICC4]AWZ14545.1 hypothetical protein DRB96_22355 [Streptomyces sp. ICC1]